MDVIYVTNNFMAPFKNKYPTPIEEEYSQMFSIIFILYKYDME